jgi:hypothetical protein
MNAAMAGEQRERLAFYLVKSGIEISHLNEVQLGAVKLEDNPMLTLDDIVSISKSDNTIELNEHAFERFSRLDPGTPFAICIDGAPKYLGRAWKQILSATSDSIVAIVQYPLQRRLIRIAAGYPTAAYFSGKDKEVGSTIVSLIQRELDRRRRRNI